MRNSDKFDYWFDQFHATLQCHSQSFARLFLILENTVVAVNDL